MRDDLELVVLPVVDGALRESVWVAYLDAFAELRSTAIQRHVMTRDEFDAVMADERVQVYLARHLDGTIAAIATLSSDLEAMPLVSPDFFRARWPEHYQAGRCWYVGLVGVRPGEQGGGAFQLIVGTVAATLGPRGGVLVLDVPQRNVDAFHVPQAVKRIADVVVRDVTMEMVDAQSYWAYTTPVPATQVRELDLRERQVVDVRDRVDQPVSGREGTDVSELAARTRRRPTGR